MEEEPMGSAITSESEVNENCELQPTMEPAQEPELNRPITPLDFSQLQSSCPPYSKEQVLQFFSHFGQKIAPQDYFAFLSECFKICIFLKLNGKEESLKGVPAAEFVNRTYAMLSVPRLWAKCLTAEERQSLQNLVATNFDLFSLRQRRRMTTIIDDWAVPPVAIRGSRCLLPQPGAETLSGTPSISIKRSIDWDGYTKTIVSNGEPRRLTARVQYAQDVPQNIQVAVGDGTSERAQASNDEDALPGITYDINWNIYGAASEQMAEAIRTNSHLPLPSVKLPPILVTCTYNILNPSAAGGLPGPGDAADGGANQKGGRLFGGGRGVGAMGSPRPHEGKKKKPRRKGPKQASAVEGSGVTVAVSAGEVSAFCEDFAPTNGVSFTNHSQQMDIDAGGGDLNTDGTTIGGL